MPEKRTCAALRPGRTAQLDCFSDQTALNFLALDAYIYGYPLVLTEVTKAAMLAGGACFNQFLQERVFPDPRYTAIVRPNVDTLYSMAWLDIAPGPVVLYVPETHGRYYLMELLDPWTNVFASIGARTTGTRAGAYAIAGPGWNGRLPEGIVRLDAPDNTVWIIGRTQTNGPGDYPEVHAVQNGFALMPLSQLGKDYPLGDSAHPAKPTDVNPADRVAAMDAAVFFQTMVRTMHANPPWINDPVMTEKLVALGLAPGNNFDFPGLSKPVRAALELSAAYGPGLIEAEAAKKYDRSHPGGWQLLRKNMGFYGADYRQRAMVALAGIGANLPQDSVYGPAFVDAAGRPLDGRNSYTIHFDKGRFPPVHAFWSITLYNQEGYLVENPLRRYAVSPHLAPLDYHADGSLNIVVGHASPGDEHTANWLPAPAGPFNLVLRLYWPERPVLDGEWQPPAIERLDR